MKRYVVLALAVLPLSAQAQPVSWGMAQCGAMMGVMERHVSQQPQKAILADAGHKMLAAARAQSRAEGRDPAELDQVHAAKRDAWQAMGGTFAFKQEFRDWIQYCRSLALSYDIALDQSMLR